MMKVSAYHVFIHTAVVSQGGGWGAFSATIVPKLVWASFG